MNPSPFVIRMLVRDGDPDGVRMLDRSNWTGKAVVFPRSLFLKVRSLPEAKKPGVYFLCNPLIDEDNPRIYIGEADEVGERLARHFAGKEKKDFWTWAVFFTSSDATLNKVHVQYLEAELVRLAREAKRITLENGNTPQKPSLSEADEAEAKGFLANMLGILPLVGIHAFEKPEHKVSSTPVLKLEGKGMVAQGYETAGGFVICKGATAVKEHVPSLSKSSVAKRSFLVQQGILVAEGDHYVLKEDQTFSSPSLAAEVILATPTNGRDAWKDKDKKSLNQLAELASPQE